MTDPGLNALLVGVPVTAAIAAIFAAGVLYQRVSTLAGAVQSIVDRLDGPEGLVAAMKSMELWRARHEVESANNIAKLGHHLEEDTAP